MDLEKNPLVAYPWLVHIDSYGSVLFLTSLDLAEARRAPGGCPPNWRHLQNCT
jgi:hypothetical protein